MASDEFDRLLRDTVQATYPPHEHEEFLAHFRGLLGMWVKDNSLGTAGVVSRRLLRNLLNHRWSSLETR